MHKHYLSEVFELSDFRRGQINLLTQNTGAGKTQLAFKLINSIPNAKSLYLIDTTAGKESLLNRKDTEVYSDHWQKFVEDKLIFIDDLDEAFAEQEIEIIFKQWENKTVVMTYQKFGRILQRYSNFTKYLDIIIMDEIHNLFKYYAIEKGRILALARKENKYLSEEQESVVLDSLSPLYKVIENINNMTEIQNYKIALTATPNKFYQFMSESNLEVQKITTNKQLYSQEVLQTIYYKDLKEVFDKYPLNCNEAMIVYLTQIKHMLELQTHLIKEKNYKVESLWSIHNNEFPMNEQQMETLKFIKEYQKLPKHIQVLILNNAYETSINIIDERIKKMIVHTTNEDSQIQAKGRIRNAVLQTLFLKYENKEQLLEIVLKDFMNKKLFAEEKDELVEKYNEVFGTKVSWRKLRNILEKNGKEIVDNRTREGSYSTISMKITL